MAEHRVPKLRGLTPLQERAFQLLGLKPRPAPPPELMAAAPPGDLVTSGMFFAGQIVARTAAEDRCCAAPNDLSK